jgi:hypothetical protein
MNLDIVFNYFGQCYRVYALFRSGTHLHFISDARQVSRQFASI